MITRILQAYRFHRAARKLEKLVAKRRATYEHRRYLERRQAALKGLGRA